MIKTPTLASVGSVALVLALAGCQAVGPMPQRQASLPAVQAPLATPGLEGEWASTDGVAISRFSGGRFETIATDTGNRLSEGTYIDRGQGSVEISMTSLIRQTTSRVNCRLSVPGQLNCTGETGNQFSLIRSQGIS